MKNKLPVIFAWSGGKDSAFALYQLQKVGGYDIRYLLSTINGNYHRLSMHGVPEELIEAQAKSIGIPLLKVFVYESNNEEYERQMRNALLDVQKEGINSVAFGDIFLEDLRIYRENNMKQLGMQCLFPLWKENTLQLVNHFIQEGFKTLTCCVNDGWLDESWCGRLIDQQFLNELPPNVDPCGENGEYHSFCFDGPIYKDPIKVIAGEKIYKELEIKYADQRDQINPTRTKGFWYCDLIPAPAATTGTSVVPGVPKDAGNRI